MRQPISCPAFRANCSDRILAGPLGGCNYLIAVSTDGTNFRQIGQPKPWCNITYSDGSREILRRRERPQWVMGPAGLPTHLMTGVLPAADSHTGLVWTMAVELL